MERKKTTIQLYGEQLEILKMALNIAENWLDKQFHMVKDGCFHPSLASELEDSYYDVHILRQDLKDGHLTVKTKENK